MYTDEWVDRILHAYVAHANAGVIKRLNTKLANPDKTTNLWLWTKHFTPNVMVQIKINTYSFGTDFNIIKSLFQYKMVIYNFHIFSSHDDDDMKHKMTDDDEILLALAILTISTPNI